MDRESYQKVKQIFQSALDVAPGDRTAFLDENCAGNNDLRREVKRLLDSFESDYLEQPMIGKMAEVVARSELAAGQIVGRYKIVEKIGAGGMGEVFLAEDTRLKRKIAVKVLPAMLSLDKERLRRFEQEACAASALNHPNILTVHEFSAEEGVIFIASEFVKGKTLRQRLDGKALDLFEALEISSQIAAALNAAHESGIIHRDIKPENIMIRADGLVKVLDFGLAKLIENKNKNDAVAQVNTTTGLVMGTPAYMSPEQARGLRTDARTDIWSLGVVLYEMLSGNAPFAGQTPSDKIASILTSEAAPFDETVPPEIEQIVFKALRKDAGERYQTVKDLLLDLKVIRNELEFRDKFDQPFEPGSNKTKTHLYNRTETIAATTEEAPPQQHTFQSVIGRYSPFFQLAFAALLLTIAGVSIWWFAYGRGKQTAPTDSASAGLFKTFQITNWANTAGEPSNTKATFSPDGKFIAFDSTKSGTTTIWVKQTNTGDAVQVTKDEFINRSPVFSPDGEEIVYYSDRGDSRGLWRVSLMGGQPNLVTKIDRQTQPRFWSKTGKIYFQDNFNLFAVDLGSGEVSKITDFPDEGGSQRIISISDDESQIAFVTPEDANWKIMVKPVKGPETRQILDSKMQIDDVVWHPDGQQLFFSRLTEEFFQIFSVGLDEGEPVQISVSDSDAFVQDVSPGGEKILFTSSNETSDLWKIDKVDAKEFLTTSKFDAELWADVSPDNSAIVYQTVRNLRKGKNVFNGSIIKQPISNDGEPLRLVENGFLPQWSPNGEKIAFLKQVDEHYEVWELETTSGSSKRIAANALESLQWSIAPYLTGHVKHLSWSPKGSGLAFSAKKEGISNIWLAPADGSGEKKLSDNQDPNQFLYCPIWRSDETGIAFGSQTKKVNSEGKKAKDFTFFIWFYNMTTNTQRKLLETEDALRLLGWTKSGEELVFAVRDKSKATFMSPPEVTVRAISLKTGRVRNLTVLREAYFFNIFLSPDKDSIGFTSRSGGSDNLWISPVEGGEPRKLTGNNDPRLYFSSLTWAPDNKTIYFGKQTRFTLLSMLVNQKTNGGKK